MQHALLIKTTHSTFYTRINNFAFDVKLVSHILSQGERLQSTHCPMNSRRISSTNTTSFSLLWVSDRRRFRSVADVNHNSPLRFSSADKTVRVRFANATRRKTPTRIVPVLCWPRDRGHQKDSKSSISTNDSPKKNPTRQSLCLSEILQRYKTSCRLLLHKHWRKQWSPIVCVVNF